MFIIMNAPGAYFAGQVSHDLLFMGEKEPDANKLTRKRGFVRVALFSF
jgi:hypothetical protein